MNKIAKQLYFIANKLQQLLNSNNNNTEQILEEVCSNNVVSGQLERVLTNFYLQNKGKYIYQLINRNKIGDNSNPLFIKAFDYLLKLKDVVSLYNLVANGLLTVEQVQKCCGLFNNRQLIKLNDIIKENSYGYTLKYSSGIGLDHIKQNLRKLINTQLYQFFIQNRSRKKFVSDTNAGKPSYWFENVEEPFLKHIQILKNNGIVLIQQDGQQWEGILSGKTANQVFRIADKQTLCPINNSMLVFNWYTDDTKIKYPVEINSYLS